MKLNAKIIGDNGKEVSKSSNYILQVELRGENRGLDYLVTYTAEGVIIDKEGKSLFDTRINSKLCPKYNAEVLPDENGNCSLCGLHKA